VIVSPFSLWLRKTVKSVVGGCTTHKNFFVIHPQVSKEGRFSIEWLHEWLHRQGGCTSKGMKKRHKPLWFKALQSGG
jgi:hypothetical protein